MKYILVTECQLLSSGNLIQEVVFFFVCLFCFVLEKNSLNVKCELVLGCRRVQREGMNVKMSEWMAYMKIINRIVPTYVGQ